MKIIHLSDLHLGKSVYEFPMIEDQAYILKKILGIIDNEKPQCILIAGDVFDRTIASTEALHLFDDFLVKLVKRNLDVFIISGNHDSADRLSFASRLIDGSGVHISGLFNGEVSKYIVSDKYGDVNIFLLPFIKPVSVKRFFPDAEINSWTDALNAVIKDMTIDSSVRNIILSHQFITGASTSDSEEIKVGGADNVDASVFDIFDYVALGHLHRPQDVGRDTVRYCGTPLKYSFSEANQDKSISIIELKEKGSISIHQVPLVPKRDMVEIKGKYLEITEKNYYEKYNRDDYFHITLTDEDDQPDAIGKLRIIYPNLMRLDYDNKRTKSNREMTDSADASLLTPIELFETLYKEQNNQDLSEKQREYLGEVIDKVWGEI